MGENSELIIVDTHRISPLYEDKKYDVNFCINYVFIKYYLRWASSKYCGDLYQAYDDMICEQQVNAISLRPAGFGRQVSHRSLLATQRALPSFLLPNGYTHKHLARLCAVGISLSKFVIQSRGCFGSRTPFRSCVTETFGTLAHRSGALTWP